MSSASANVFPEHIKRALDSYQVPALPSDFSERLVEKALGQSGSSKNSRGGSSWKRNHNISPWKRGGYLASGVVGFGIVSAAAAAALSLADVPIRIPVMSDLVERVLPVSTARADDTRITIVEQRPEKQPFSGKEDDSFEKSSKKSWRDMNPEERRTFVKERVVQNEKRVQERRAQRGLPPLTEKQLKIRRAAIRRALANPETRKPIVKRAIRRASLRKAVENGTVDIDAVKTRIGDRQTQKVSDQPETMDSEKLATDGDGSVLSENAENVAVEAVPEQSIAATDSAIEVDTSDVTAIQLSPEQRQILREKLSTAAKKRLQEASPAERQRMLRDLRKRRQDMRLRREHRKKLRNIRNRTK